jgi:protein-S-isoprenylcysteine O-methyltransferase Ste14
MRDWWVTVIFILAFCLYYERIIIAEESFMRRKFGKTYEDYAAQTPVLFEYTYIPVYPLSDRISLLH